MENKKAKEFIEANTICCGKILDDKINFVSTSGSSHLFSTKEFSKDRFMKSKVVSDFEKLFTSYISEAKRVIIQVDGPDNDDVIFRILRPVEKEFVSYDEDMPIINKKNCVVIDLSTSLNKELSDRIINGLANIVERKIKSHFSLACIHTPTIALNEEMEFLFPDVAFIDKDIEINEYISNKTTNYVDLEKIVANHNNEVKKSSNLQIKFNI